MRLAPCLVLAGLALVALSAVQADDKSGLDGEGFVQQWLVLAPIPLKDGEDGAAGLGRDAVADEAKLHPKAGDKGKDGDKELAWKAYTAQKHMLNFTRNLVPDT